MQSPSRKLELNGATNFRDLGGYIGHGGRAVRWRKLFRSDHLAALSVEDQSRLAELGLARACDFRGALERAPQACAMPGVHVFSLAIEPTVVQGMQSLLAAGKELTPHATVELMEQTYRDFVLHNSPQFAQLFGHLLDNDAPLVFHCTAGKDRTGFAAALVLSALGVPRPVVMQDYLLTNQFFQQPKATSGIASQEVLDILWRVQERFLEASLQAVQAGHGGVDGYLENALGLGQRERDRLQSLYLEV